MWEPSLIFVSPSLSGILGSRGWFSFVFLKHQAWTLLNAPPPSGYSLQCSDWELQASLASGQGSSISRAAAEGQLGLIPLACEAKEQRPFAFLDLPRVPASSTSTHSPTTPCTSGSPCPLCLWVPVSVCPPLRSTLLGTAEYAMTLDRWMEACEMAERGLNKNSDLQTLRTLFLEA